MRLIIAAVGRLKAGPERDFSERDSGRVEKGGRSIGFRSLDIVEVRESRAQEAQRRAYEESVTLTGAIPDGAVMVALDEKGSSLDSGTFALNLQRWRDAGRPATVFIIGGAEGLSPEIRQRADLTLAFGATTWPHQLVRIMLLEQLYRAVTILAGHPYHRP